MKRLFLLVFFVFWAGLVRAEDCFTPAFFHTGTNRLELPCVVVVGHDKCYWAVLHYEEQEEDLYLVLDEVGVSDVELSKVSYEMQQRLPNFDPLTGILYLPVVKVDDTPFEAYLRLEERRGQTGFVVQIINREEETPPEVCWAGGNGPVYSWLLRDTNTKAPIVCHEFRGHPEYVNMAAAFPPNLNPGLTEWVGDYVPCPSGFEWGCYIRDEDQNEYTYYRYSHPLADYVGYRVCPVENGYQLITP